MSILPEKFGLKLKVVLKLKNVYQNYRGVVTDGQS